MRFKYFIIVIQLVLFWHGGICQKAGQGKDDDATVKDDSKYSPTNLELAKFQINDIKTRGIIIRLRTDKTRIDAYKKAGNTKVAAKLEDRLEATNLLLMYAFITEWTYSPVYFMESQYTTKLLKEDTLMAKTLGLNRDTAIYCNHDSFYILDYGELMTNQPSSENTKFLERKTEQSNSAASVDCMVMKTHNQQQLQPPMPCFSKLVFEEFTSTDKLTPIELSSFLTDSFSHYLSIYPTINELIRSEAKAITKKYLDSVYYHIKYESKKLNDIYQHNNKLSSGAFGYEAPMVKGNPFQNAAKRLNNKFIAYYCRRLDKDKNILCQDDPYYWWMRNPNIRYLPYLHDIEVELKKLLDRDSTFIKIH